MKRIVIPAIALIVLAGCTGKKPAATRTSAVVDALTRNQPKSDDTTKIVVLDANQAISLRDSLLLVDSTYTVFIEYQGARPAELPANSVFLRH